MKNLIEMGDFDEFFFPFSYRTKYSNEYLIFFFTLNLERPLASCSQHTA